MPITVDALVLGLTAGAISFKPNELQFSNFTTNPTYNNLKVQVFGTGVVSGQALQTAAQNGSFSTATNTGDAAPNFKVKTYLSAPVVCPIATTGNAGKIAFAITHPNGGANSIAPGATETAATADGFGNQAPIPAVASGDLFTEAYGDVFMVITVSPAIAVTAGGYLTVKGWQSGVSGSENYTYVTLQSGS